MSRAQPVHPFIYMLVERLGEIDLFYRHREYVPAWEIMLGTIDDIREIHRTEYSDLRELIEKSIRMVEKQGGRDPVQSFSRRARIVRKIIDGRGRTIRQRFSKMLWDGKYLLAETYVGIIPASTLKKQKETPEEKPFPERLPEDLR